MDASNRTRLQEGLRLDAGTSAGLETVRSSSPRLLISLSCGAGFLALFAWLAGRVFTGDIDRFDSRVRTLVHAVASLRLTEVMRDITFLGSFRFLSVLFVALIALALTFGLRRQAAWFAIAVAGELLLELTLKAAYHRPRPVPFFLTGAPGFSFPSGHALGSLCFYGVAAGLACPCIKTRRVRILLCTGAAALILAIGLSRIYLGVHYPSDVIAGYLAGGLWVSSLLFVARARHAYKPVLQRTKDFIQNSKT